MIYMIEIDYADPASEPEWNAWYDGYLADLVTVPGIETAQRFRGDNEAAKRHLAIYTLAGLSVYAEPRYKEVGGGGFASAKWKEHIRRRRNLYNGIDRVPSVGDGSRLIVTEAAPEALDLADVIWVSLSVMDMRALQADKSNPLSSQVPFENDPAHRHVAIVPAARAAELAGLPSIAIYRPSSPRLVNGGRQ